MLEDFIRADPARSVKECCNKIKFDYPWVWNQIHDNQSLKSAQSSSKVYSKSVTTSRHVRRAVAEMRERSLQLCLLPQWAEWVNANYPDYNVKVTATEDRIYQRTLIVSGHAKKLFREGFLSNVFRLDFTHVATPNNKGVIGCVVANVCNQFVLPCVLLHSPTNETLDLWQILIDAVAQHFPSHNTVLVTDGFPGVAALVMGKQMLHLRCVYHLAASCQKLLKGKSVSAQLWKASLATDLNGFMEEMIACFRVNPVIAEFLCPKVTAAIASTSHNEELSKFKKDESELIFRNIDALGLTRISTGSLPSKIDLINLMVKLKLNVEGLLDLPAAKLFSLLIEFFQEKTGQKASQPPDDDSLSEESSNDSSSSSAEESSVSSEEDNSPDPPSSQSSASVAKRFESIKKRALEDTSTQEIETKMEYLFSGQKPLPSSQATTFAEVAASMPFMFTNWQMVQLGGSALQNCSTNSAESWNSLILTQKKTLPTAPLICEIFKKMVDCFYSLQDKLLPEIAPQRLTLSEPWNRLLERQSEAQKNGYFIVPLQPQDVHEGTVRFITIRRTEAGFVRDNRIDLQLKSCTCFYWQASGMPCSHVLTAIGSGFLTLENSIHKPLLIQPLFRFLEQVGPVPPMRRFDAPRNSKSLQKLTLPPQPTQKGRPRLKRNKSTLESKNSNSKSK